MIIDNSGVDEDERDDYVGDNNDEGIDDEDW